MKIIFSIDTEHPDWLDETTALLHATKMKSSIDSLYQDVFKKYFKYSDLAPDDIVLIQKIWDEVAEHFKGEWYA